MGCRATSSGSPKHLHYEKGRSISVAIATAINHAKKMCASGTAFGGKVKVSAKAQSVACKAVAEWEAKKARSKGKKVAEAEQDESLSPQQFQEIGRLIRLSEPDQGRRALHRGERPLPAQHRPGAADDTAHGRPGVQATGDGSRVRAPGGCGRTGVP